ncbi:hypothetical protein MY4038_007011 [Beauveria bassiana]
MTSPHRGRKRLQPPRIKKIKITIPLPSRPADYVPNSGPPLRRLALQPPADSTAFIDDRILLPPSGLAADGRPLPKRMRYIVGWRDLPAARLLVSAMDVLDYVSPHALEEWEYSMELELDVDRARLAAERQALKTQQTLLGRADELPLPKAARPPPHHTSIEAAVVAETEDGDGEQGRLRGGALSLSTPKKRKMDDFLDGYTSDESPSEQLFFDIAKSAQKEDDSLSPGKEESDDKVPEVRSAPVAPVALMAPMASVYPKMPILTSDDGKPVYRSHVARKVEKHNRKTNQKPWTPSSGKARRPPVFDSSSEADDETDWAVDRIEDMELYDVEGRGLVRYFKVRWEGDWPPDQNPTWEPEENLPDDLVHEFCRTFKSRKKGSSEQSRPTRNDADQAARLPPLRPTNRIGEDRENDRPSSAHSGMFVYSSDDGMEKHRWDAPNSQGVRPNLNGVFPANMA